MVLPKRENNLLYLNLLPLRKRHSALVGLSLEVTYSIRMLKSLFHVLTRESQLGPLELG